MPHEPQILSAIEANDITSLKTLISASIPNSCEINALNPNDETYFHIAVKRLIKPKGPYHLQILELLLEKGINPQQRNKQQKPQ